MIGMTRIRGLIVRKSSAVARACCSSVSARESHKRSTHDAVSIDDSPGLSVATSRHRVFRPHPALV